MRKKDDDDRMDGEDIQGELAASLVADYAAAHYFVTIGHREWLFGVGQYAQDVERQLSAESYLFITAWNPAPNTATLVQNTAADERLQARIRESGFHQHSALASDARGGAVEYGWLVLDVPVETGDAWACEFGQAGTLYWKRGGPVRLRMLCPRPAGVEDQPHTDWAG